MPRHGRHRKKPAADDIRWVILDCLVHRTKGGVADEVAEELWDAADGTLSEICYTCTGRPLVVSVRVAPPPAVSRLYLHWPEGLRPEMSSVYPPSIIAAHGHSVLFKARVPHLDKHRSIYYPIDYFVYTARRSAAKSPSLRRLPPCFDFKEGQVEQEIDHLFQPYRLQQQRAMNRANIGLLCRGDEEFTVAELSSRGELCLLHHAPPGEGNEAMDWEIKTVRMPYGEGAVPDLFGRSRQTDVIIPFGGSYLCWVDYYLGLLFVGVRGEVTKKPNCVPMPASLDSRRLYIDAGAPDLARRVCVTGIGTIKLICISDDAGRSLHGPSRLDFKITSWDLVKKKWEKDATMEASHFWAALESDKRLPQLRPEFPAMSLVDPDAVCLVLNEDHRIQWLVEVNLKKMVLGPVTLYISGDDEEGCSADMTRRTYLEGPFISSKFTLYLDKHSIKSLAFSKKLEEAKLKRAMENGWIEHPIEELLLDIG